MGYDSPFGSEIAAAILGLVVLVLIGIARKIMSGESRPSEHATNARLEQVARQIRHELGERLEQHDRAIKQSISSLNDNLARQHRDKEVEDRRQFERLQDKVDRLRNGPNRG